MYKILAVVLVVVLIALADVAPLFAKCGVCRSSASSSKVQAAAEESVPVNEKCPVMGENISKDTPYKLEYKGKTMGFCCPSCVEAFKANPDKYMANIKKQTKG